MDPNQFALGFWIFVISAVVGLAVKLVLDQTDNTMEITWTEYFIGLAIVGTVFSLIAVSVGWGMAKANVMSFNEFWGGWEKTATTQPYGCTKDGPCIYSYDCDVYYTYTSDCDGHDKDGNCTGYTTHRHTHYHACPVYTVETNYYIGDTFDQNHLIGNHCIDANPVRWGVGTGDYDASGSAPNACVGAPAFWQAANQRVNVLHQPGPAFKKNTYDNLVIASDTELYQAYAGYVQDYLKSGVLPQVASPDGIHDFYWKETVYFVGITPTDPESWNVAIRNVDGGFGDELHGTLHVVIVKSDKVDLNPDRYITSLKSYWQDPKFCQDNCFAKNGVVVVVGTQDGLTVSWARAETGMPVGNTDLIQHAMTDLIGVPITPEGLIGRIIPDPYVRDDGKEKVRVLHPNPGAIETLVWGLKFPETEFGRISMRATDADDLGTGFKYLDALIRPTKDQQAWILVICTLLSFVVWVAGAMIGERQPRWRGPGYRR